MDIELILLSSNNTDPVDAQCHWSLSNKGKNQNFVGGIKRKTYRLNQSEIDSEFDNSVLKDCTSDCIITIGVMQFFEEDEAGHFKKENASIFSAGKKLTMAEKSDEEEDLIKTTVNPLY